MAHIRMLHSELAEHWQKVVGSRGPRSPRLGPMEPVTLGCQIADLEPLSGGGGRKGSQQRRLASWIPTLSPFQAEAMGEGRHPFLGRAHLSVPSRTFSRYHGGLSTQSAFTELCVGLEIQRWIRWSVLSPSSQSNRGERPTNTTTRGRMGLQISWGYPSLLLFLISCLLWTLGAERVA